MIPRSRLVALAVLALVALLQADKQETVQELVARAEAAKPAQRADLYLQAAQTQLSAADRLFTEGNIQQAHADVQDVVLYAGKAAEATMQARKKLTSTEISIRKMSQKVRDIRRTVSFEDQQPLQIAADKLEKLRTDLLAVMFQKEKK